MDKIINFLKELPKVPGQWLDQLNAYLPNLLGSTLLMFFGWGVAIFLRSLSIRMTGMLNRILSRLFSKGNLAKFRLSEPLVVLFSRIIFWGTILVFCNNLHTNPGIDRFFRFGSTDWSPISQV